jgi:hypothetical protein
MTSHLGLMLLFAACVSTVFGTLLRDVPREMLRLAVRVFIALAGGGYLLGWIMYLVYG